jgi:peptidoglycan hydrolase-like protein with peptidoglycan-binding domain
MMNRAVGVLVALSLAVVAACGKGESERRAREAEEKIRASIPDVEARALEQQVGEGVVRAAQEQLTKLNEYQGEVNGKLDMVTVNAIQAFQRARGLKTDGLLSEDTVRLLEQASSEKSS